MRFCRLDETFAPGAEKLVSKRTSATMPSFVTTFNAGTQATTYYNNGVYSSVTATMAAQGGQCGSCSGIGSACKFASYKSPRIVYFPIGVFTATKAVVSFSTQLVMAGVCGGSGDDQSFYRLALVPWGNTGTNAPDVPYPNPTTSEYNLWKGGYPTVTENASVIVKLGTQYRNGRGWTSYLQNFDPTMMYWVEPGKKYALTVMAILATDDYIAVNWGNAALYQADPSYNCSPTGSLVQALPGQGVCDRQDICKCWQCNQTTGQCAIVNSANQVATNMYMSSPMCSTACGLPPSPAPGKTFTATFQPQARYFTLNANNQQYFNLFQSPGVFNAVSLTSFNIVARYSLPTIVQYSVYILGNTATNVMQLLVSGTSTSGVELSIPVPAKSLLPFATKLGDWTQLYVSLVRIGQTNVLLGDLQQLAVGAYGITLSV